MKISLVGVPRARLESIPAPSLAPDQSPAVRTLDPAGEPRNARPHAGWLARIVGPPDSRADLLGAEHLSRLAGEEFDNEIFAARKRDGEVVDDQTLLRTGQSKQRASPSRTPRRRLQLFTDLANLEWPGMTGVGSGPQRRNFRRVIILVDDLDVERGGPRRRSPSGPFGRRQSQVQDYTVRIFGGVNQGGRLRPPNLDHMVQLS